MEPHKNRKLVFSLCLFLSVWILCHWTSLARVFGEICGVFLPILIGLALAFVLNLPLRFLERIWSKLWPQKSRRVRRAVCLLLSFLLAVGVLVLLMWCILPQLIETVSELLRTLSSNVENLEALWGKLAEQAAEFSVTLPPLDLDHSKISAQLAGWLENYGHVFMEFSVSALFSVFGTVFDTFVAVAVSVYVLSGKERIGGQIQKFLHTVLSHRHAETVVGVASLTSRSFANFLTGQVTEAVILGVLCFVGMLLFGMPFAPLISVLIGVTALIPVFGAFIGIGVGAVLILSVDPILAVWFVVFVVVLQQLEGNLIYPRVVGKSVGLPGVWVLIAVTVGSSFGVVGMLVSVPLASIAYTLLRNFANREKFGEKTS